MWVKRAEYERLLKAEAAHTATVEWMRVRVNQLEQMTAELTAKVTGVAPAVPVIHRDPVLNVKGADPEALFPQLRALFEDVGDDAAEHLGIRHDPEGVVVYDH